MVTDKKNLPEIRLYSYDGDLSKEWFIYWYEGPKRIKKYTGINKENSIEGRSQAAEALKALWLEKLSEKIDGFKGTAYQKQYKKLSDYLDQVRHNWRKKTEQTHLSRMSVFLRWNQRHEITGERIKEFLAYQLSIGKQQNTVGGYFRTFKNVFVPVFGKNILEGINIKKADGTPAQYFSHGQVRFLSVRMAEQDPKLWLGVQLLYYCFIRPGESRLLKVGDILLEESKICIPKEISKNKKTQYVIIPDAFMEDLENAVLGRNPSEYILGAKNPMSVNYLSQKHQAFLKSLNFDTKRHKLYSWKHTGAVAAVKSGIHIKQLQMQLRHHSLDQVNAYLRQLGVMDLEDFSSKMPKI